MVDAQVFDDLGFAWNRSLIPTDVPVHSVERAVFRLHRSLPEYVWDASVLEGNPFTFVEVQTLMDGVTVGGHRISDERQVENLAVSARELVRSVREGRFTLAKATSDRLHSLIARDEAFDAGFFRDEGVEQRLTPGVALGQYGNYLPVATEPGGDNLRELYARGLTAMTTGVTMPYEQALAYFLFGALRQFYFDGNKRTARYLMNGHLMANGLDAISVPARRAREFNTLMVEFYRFRDASRMMAFLTDCHPDAEEIAGGELRALLD